MFPCQQVSTEPTLTPAQGQSLGWSAGSVPGGVEEGSSHPTHAGGRSHFDGGSISGRCFGVKWLGLECCRDS